jgi:hypothetical protein
MFASKELVGSIPVFRACTLGGPDLEALPFDGRSCIIIH